MGVSLHERHSGDDEGRADEGVYSSRRDVSSDPSAAGFSFWWWAPLWRAGKPMTGLYLHLPPAAALERPTKSGWYVAGLPVAALCYSL